jgi:protein-S-isoprenylcysteine O-methyltransferase Ste14
MEIRKRWIDILHRAATGTKKTRTLLTPIGVAIFGAFTAVFVLVALLVDRLLSLPGVLPEGARLPVSIPVMAMGTAFTVWSALHFLRVKGTPVPFNPPPEVVTTGPYRYARNPMLTGVFLFLLGLGLGLDSFSLVFIFTPLYVLFNVWELKQIEEPELVKRFGDEYIDYRIRTPMFIPVLWPGSKRPQTHQAGYGHRQKREAAVKTILDIVNRSPKPVPWSEGDNIPWDEPGFSDRMLAEHLSQDHDLASRKSVTID